jgi:hypothetical protein
MRLRTFCLTLLLAGVARSSQADDSMTGWIADRVHPQLEYRFKCVRGGLTIEWRNSYPGAVTLTARIKGSSYDGDENVVIPPSGSARSSPETMYCTAEFFEMTEKRFSMAPPPPPAAATAEKPSGQKPNQPASSLPTVAPWAPPAKIPELPREAFAAIQIGMQREEVLHRIGAPTSKLSIPEENELVETYRYPVSPGLAGAIRFSNGVVTEVILPP